MLPRKPVRLTADSGSSPRHTFASLLITGGASLETIGRLFGHTQIGTTQRYAHLINAPLRAGVNSVGEMLKPRLRVVGDNDAATGT